MIRQEEVFKIGYFGKPHGTAGEINLVTRSEVLDEAEDPYIICDMDGILVPFFVEEYRDKSDSVILVKLEKVDSGEQARAFTNKEVFYPLEAIADTDDLVGDITWDSFIGYEVEDTQAGLLGTITEVDESTVNVLFKVIYKNNELLIPAAEEIIQSVDPTGKRIVLTLPAGLIELSMDN